MTVSEQPVSLTDRASRAAVWVSAQALFVKVSSLLSQLLLARFLLREDFGLYALAMTVYSFAGLLHQAGIQEVLIRRHRSFRIWANTAFWLSLATGIGACLLTIAFAPLAVRFYNTTQPAKLTQLIVVLSTVFPLMSAGAVCRARLQIEMRFREFALLGTINVLLDATLKVLLAWAGFGAFSFGYSTVVTAIVYLALSWLLAPIPVKWTPQLRRWRYLLGDGLMVIGAGFFYWLIEEGDYIVLGRFEREAVIGTYFFAYKISRHSMSLLTQQFSKVLFPALSRLPAETGQQSRAFERAARLIAVASMPCCFCMAAVADPLIRLLFEPRWYPAIPMVQIMCLGMSLRTISWPAASLMQAQGRFRTRMLLSIVSVFFFFPMTILGTWLGSAIGLSLAVAVFYSLVAITDVSVAMWPTGHVLGSLRRIFAVPLLANVVAAAPAGLIAYAVVPSLPVPEMANRLLQLCVVPIVMLPAYSLLIRLLASDVWRDARERVRRIISASSRTRVWRTAKS
jgi:PST family polysaccharide transporter